ncbi:MAG: hypothetical protein JWR81_909 [Pseudonocardia sp.]|nr:hypothetical protein [Pseudonocardia sp.]
MSDRSHRRRWCAVLAVAVVAVAVIGAPSAYATERAPRAAVVSTTPAAATLTPTAPTPMTPTAPTAPTPTAPTPAVPVPTRTKAVPAAVPTPDHVVVVVEENEDASAIIGNKAAPYLTSLAARSATFTHARAETHPSQPNYMALFSGGQQGVSDDSCVGRLSAPNLGSELLAAGKSFVGYSEDLPRAGFTGCTSGRYAQKHSPWTAFADIPAASNQPWTAWPADYAQLPTVSWVTPNLCDDMHDCGVASGDRWLEANLAGYLSWAATHNSWLIVTWDEASDSSPDNGIATMVAGAGVRPGRYAEQIDHYSLLRTIENAYGLQPLGDSATAEPITDIWAPAASSAAGRSGPTVAPAPAGDQLSR